MHDSHSLCSGLDHAIAKALGWLLDRQENSGAWKDFDLDVGPSTSWVTSVVLLGLSHVHVNSASAASRACEFLLSASGDNSGWGYNENVSEDCDSTSHAVIALREHGFEVPRKALECIRSFGVEGGRFRTFHYGHRFSSWQLVHDEVGAIAAIALQDRVAADSTAEAMLEEVQDKGFVASFWWARPIYSTYAASWMLRSLCPDASSLQNALPGILNATMMLSSPLTAALSTMAAIYLNNIDAANRGLAVLLETQLSDGGWNPSRLLRCTDADCADGWLRRRECGGPVVEDLRGIYSTAVALRTMCLFRKVRSPNHD